MIEHVKHLKLKEVLANVLFLSLPTLLFPLQKHSNEYESFQVTGSTLKWFTSMQGRQEDNLSVIAIHEFTKT